jgi:hypothetical protein
MEERGVSLRVWGVEWMRGGGFTYALDYENCLTLNSSLKYST